MEEMQAKQQNVFEELTKENRKLLRKEFNANIEFRFKFFFWIGFGLLLLALVSGGFSIYFMINIFIEGIVAFQFYICAAIFTLGCIVALFFTSKYHKKFRIWLKENKNIVTRVKTNKQ